MSSYYKNIDFSSNHKLEFHLPVSDQMMALTIGQKGQNFIQWTEESSHTFIWHNRELDIIEIYTKGSIESLINTYNKIMLFSVQRIIEGLNMGIFPTSMDRSFLNKYINQEFPNFEIDWIDLYNNVFVIPDDLIVYTPPKSISIAYDKKKYIYVLENKDLTCYYEKTEKKIPETLYYNFVKKSQTKAYPVKLGWGDDEYWELKDARVAQTAN